MLLLIGCHKFPDHKIYWDTIPEARSDSSVNRNTFERILRNFHLCDNEQLDKINSLSLFA